MKKNKQLNDTQAKTLKKYHLLLFLLLLAPLFWKCISPPDYLGVNLIPSQDYLQAKVDTSFELSGYTIAGDTIDTRSFSEAVVGTIYDEVFGRTRASLLSSVRLSSLNHDFGDSLEIDSIHLMLKLNESYGDPTIPLKIYLHELTDTLSKDSVYNGLAPLSEIYNPEPIGSVTYQGGDTLRIPIAPEWANKFVTADSASLSSQEDFATLFKGVFITTNHFTNYGKSVHSFDWVNDINGIYIFYKKFGDDTTTSAQFSMKLNSYCTRYIHFEHDYTAASSNFKINYLNDTINQDSVFYVQGLGGVKGMIKLEDIKSWTDSMPIAINRAQLIIERETRPDLPADTAISTLLPYYMKDNNKILLDDSNLSYGVDGKFNNRNQNYSFNITLHLQKLISGEIESNLLYLEPETYVKANRSILRSGSHSGKMKLIITYTKL